MAFISLSFLTKNVIFVTFPSSIMCPKFNITDGIFFYVLFSILSPLSEFFLISSVIVDFSGCEENKYMVLTWRYYIFPQIILLIISSLP